MIKLYPVSWMGRLQADSNRWYPGAGHIDFKSVLAALEDSGYRGWVSGEFLPKPDAETAARESIAYLRKL